MQYSVNAEALTVTLPNGFWHDGTRCQEAVIRPLVGRDEEVLISAGGPENLAGWTTTVLERCVESLDPLNVVDRGAVRSLTIGDREALLLHVRRATLGDSLPAVLRCPACGEKMDLELSVSDLLLDSHPHEEPVHETTFEENEQTYRARFRLPTGSDQEAMTETTATGAKEAARQLVHRCVDVIRGEDGSSVPGPKVPESLLEKLSDRMKALDPQAELIINSKCPFCDHGFSRLFDAAAYFSKELGGREARFYREVHTLAFYYHWSEQEIMRLTLPQRHRYIELINETLSEDRR